MERNEQLGTPSDDDPSLLVIIIDLHPFYWAEREEKEKSQKLITFETFHSHLLIFMNAFLMLHHRNSIAIIASSPLKSEMLFPPDSTEKGYKPTFEETKPILTNRIKEFIQTIEGNNNSAYVFNIPYSQRISFCCTRVNQYLHNHHFNNTPEDSSTSLSSKKGSMFAGALSKALCYINRIKKVEPAQQPRILAINISPDISAQHVPIMNCIFSAQKMSIPVDACVLDKIDSTFLQQASHLTGGIYLRPIQQIGLVGYLLSSYLLDRYTQQYFHTPKQSTVDYRAACFCHKKVIRDGLGFVCSVCLSIFCEFQPVCTTCGAKFALPALKE